VDETEEFAFWINERAATTRDEMPAALARIADQVEREQADAVVVVGEAWTAPVDAVKAGEVANSLHAGNAPAARR
jgi:hypothetical protein